MAELTERGGEARGDKKLFEVLSSSAGTRRKQRTNFCQTLARNSAVNPECAETIAPISLRSSNNNCPCATEVVNYRDQMTPMPVNKSPSSSRSRCLCSCFDPHQSLVVFLPSTFFIPSDNVKMDVG